MGRCVAVHFVQYQDFSTMKLETYSFRMIGKLWNYFRIVAILLGLSLVVLYAATCFYVIQQMKGTGATVADCGIVFGAAVRRVFNEEGGVVEFTAGPGIERRVSIATTLAKQGRLHRLFFTGGRGEKNAKSEARVMQEYAISLGVPAERITLEERSRSTWENLLYTRPLTENCRSMLAISDGYHLARIRMIAHIQGWDLPTYPADIKPNALFTVRNLLREAVGIDLLVLMLLSR